MTHAMKSGFGYTYVLSWVFCVNLALALYYMLAKLKFISYVMRYPWAEVLFTQTALISLPLYIICETAFTGALESSDGYKIAFYNYDTIQAVKSFKMFAGKLPISFIDSWNYTFYFKPIVPTIDILFGAYILPLMVCSILLTWAMQMLLFPLPIIRSLNASDTGAKASQRKLVFGLIFTLILMFCVAFSVFHLPQAGRLLYSERASQMCLLIPLGIVFFYPAAIFRKFYLLRLQKKAQSQGIDIPPV